MKDFSKKVQNNAKFSAKQFSIETAFLKRKCFHFTLFSAKRVLLPAQTIYSWRIPNWVGIKFCKSILQGYIEKQIPTSGPPPVRTNFWRLSNFSQHEICDPGMPCHWWGKYSSNWGSFCLFQFINYHQENLSYFWRLMGTDPNFWSYFI